MDGGTARVKERGANTIMHMYIVHGSRGHTQMVGHWTDVCAASDRG